MAQLYYRRHEVGRLFEPCSWQAVVFNEFPAALLSTSRPFPCIFGAAGFEPDQLRFTFIECMDSPWLFLVLGGYLKDARKFGSNTSLVSFSMPGATR
jgi:FPC/CPF motif-containing protein YcgG